MRYNPFNPQQPARPDFFIGREPEIIEFEKYLTQTLHGSPMNMAITGNRGIGKTSLLMKFEDIAKQNNCLVLRLSNYEGNISSIIDFANYVSSNLKGEIISRRPLEKIKEWMKTLKPVIEWNEVTLSVEKKQVIQELFRQRLRGLWDELKSEYGACVILIDEAESLERIEGALTFLREVFQRLSSDANYMVVLAGKLNFPERMSESFSPLNRFFPCSRLIPFNDEEMNAYVIRKLATVNVGIDKNALKLIGKDSEGHPYVLVSMCYHLFDSLKETEKHITEEVYRRALQKISNRLDQDFFSPMYHPLTPKAKSILTSIIPKMKGVEFTFKESVEWSGLPRNYVSPYIQELLRKGIINKPERGKYRFFHILFMDYVRNEAKYHSAKITLSSKHHA